MKFSEYQKAMEETFPPRPEFPGLCHTYPGCMVTTFASTVCWICHKPEECNTTFCSICEKRIIFSYGFKEGQAAKEKCHLHGQENVYCSVCKEEYAELVAAAKVNEDG